MVMKGKKFSSATYEIIVYNTMCNQLNIEKAFSIILIIKSILFCDLKKRS